MSPSPLGRSRIGVDIGGTFTDLVLDTPVYDRYSLGALARLDGPAIIEERESTTVIGPGAKVRVDAHLTLVAEPGS
jgi:N-methylhydantoinase A/oxoprolinase/acetone carboxylase beta subunit